MAVDVFAIVSGGMRNLATDEFVESDLPAGALVPATDLTPSDTLTPAGA